MKKLILVTNQGMVIAVPVHELIKMQDGDDLAGVVIINQEEKPKEE